MNITDDGTYNTLDGASYTVSPTRVPTGSAANTILSIAAFPSLNLLISGTTTDWTAWANAGTGFNPQAVNVDHFITAISGTFTPAVSGTYNFYWNTDDSSVMYMDIGNTGTWNTKIANYQWTNNGNVSLTAGVSYNYIYMEHEYGGGQNIDWEFSGPGIAQQRVDPSVADQAGLWSATGVGPVTLSNPVIITGNSTIDASGVLYASLGPLSMGSGFALTAQGAPVTFASTTLSGPATFIANSATTLGQVTGGIGATITEQGGASLVFNYTGGAAGLDATSTIDIQSGRMVGVASSTVDPLGGGGGGGGGGAIIQLHGGNASLSSTGGTVAFDDAVNVITSGTLTAQANSGYGGVAGGAITLGSAARGVTIASGQTLTLATGDNYTLTVNGPVSGPATSTIPAPST